MAASREDGGRGGGVPSSLSNELSQIRNTESSILSQLADLKYVYVPTFVSELYRLGYIVDITI